MDKLSYGFGKQLVRTLKAWRKERGQLTFFNSRRHALSLIFLTKVKVDLVLFKVILLKKILFIKFFEKICIPVKRCEDSFFT